MGKKSKNASSVNQSDPFADREATKYDSPIPSREFILEHLTSIGYPVKHGELANRLGLGEEPERHKALSNRLRAMIRDGQIMCNRRREYGLISKMDLVSGRIQGHRDGFGFLIPDDGSDDLFLSPGQMRSVFDGDRALVNVKSVDRKGRREGRMVEVIERGLDELIGRFFVENGVSYVVPDNRRICQEIHIEKSGRSKVKPGQIVVVKIVSYPTFRAPAQGRIAKVVGDHMAAGMEIEIALQSHDIPSQWPLSVIDDAKVFSAKVPKSALKGRVDVRDLPLVTIDGEDARDFDDAVYCEKKKSGGWRLLVAIADVSHYVLPKSSLDEEAEKRGNSVYFPDFVVPMLPEVLSNGLCSLNPDVDRLCMICEMSISAKGKISRYKFYEGIMRSHARFTYTQVGAFLEAGEQYEETELAQSFPNLVAPIQTLHGLYKTLKVARSERGTLEIESTETRIVFGENRKIEKIVPTSRNEAHCLIEECMLCANVSAARFLDKHELPGLYRVHEGPSDDKLENLQNFVGPLGLKMPKSKKLKPADLQSILEQAKDRPDRNMIQTVVLRSMKQAVYAPENLGHFGLSYPAYAHFTSPIRRYADLLVHRAIRYFIRSRHESVHVERVPGAKRLAKAEFLPYTQESMVELGGWISSTERRADLATRDVVDWLKCEYMMSRVGEVYEGVITTVTSFGLFVELKDIYVEGLVHVATLASDYYHFDPVRHCLAGEHSGRVLQMGDSVEIRVVRVDLDERKIEFFLTSDEGEAGERPPRRGTVRRRGMNPKSKDGAGDRGKGKSKGKSRGKSGARAESDSGSKSNVKSKDKAKSKKKTHKGRNKKAGATADGGNSSKPSTSKPSASKANKPEGLKKKAKKRVKPKSKSAPKPS